MSEPFIGEIRMFAGTFAPRGWALCDGQLLAISQNDALFSLLGTTYGGDGRTTFGLPDLRGRVPVHAGSGTGPGLSARPLGQKAGSETVTLTTQQIPSHAHTPVKASTEPADDSNPAGKALAATSYDVYITNPTVGLTDLAAGAVTSVGGSQPHDNAQPFLCVNFIIALVGIYPSRN